MSNTRTTISVLAASATLLTLTACASTPQPVPEVAAAHALISQAEQSDATQFASSDLEAARSKVRLADQDVHDNKPILAAKLGQESSVDAEVAIARTRAMKSEQALKDVNAGTSTLRNETLRQGTPPTSTVIVVPSDSTATVTQPLQR
jgi:hypothetical protein